MKTNLISSRAGIPQMSRPRGLRLLLEIITKTRKMAIQLKKNFLQKKKWNSSKKRNPLMLHFRTYPTPTSDPMKNTTGNDARGAIPRTNMQNTIGINKNSWIEEHHRDEVHHPEAPRPGARAATIEEWIPSFKITEAKNTTKLIINTKQKTQTRTKGESSDVTRSHM